MLPPPEPMFQKLRPCLKAYCHVAMIWAKKTAGAVDDTAKMMSSSPNKMTSSRRTAWYWQEKWHVSRWHPHQLWWLLCKGKGAPFPRRSRTWAQGWKTRLRRHRPHMHWQPRHEVGSEPISQRPSEPMTYFHSCDLAQLRWQTKELRKSTSPIFGWPQNLVQQALRQLSSEGALARKEFAWPLPLTPMFFQPWLLEILEGIWNFDLSALVMLGEPACGKSPLGRSVLMAQCRFNKKSTRWMASLASGAVQRLTFWGVRQALLSWATS